MTVRKNRTRSFNNINYGAAAYGLHARRFNYLFHDGHVSTLKITDTVGRGTTNAPLWHVDDDSWRLTFTVFSRGRSVGETR